MIRAHRQISPAHGKRRDGRESRIDGERRREITQRSSGGERICGNGQCDQCGIIQMKPEGAAFVAVAKDAVGGISPTEVAGAGLIGDRLDTVRQAGKSPEVASRICQVSLGILACSENAHREDCAEYIFKFHNFHTVNFFLVNFLRIAIGPHEAFTGGLDLLNDF